MPTTRLAPSPTGALHLGNARTFLVNWALARQQGWRVLLRIEDLDGPRIKQGAAQEAIETLAWLGIDWDEGPIHQSEDLQPYEQALRRLTETGHAYPCRCTRSQILAASLSAPNQGDHELRYPGTCRPEARAKFTETSNSDGQTAWRLITPEGVVSFRDRFVGEQSFDPQREVGDFLIATKQGLPSYQLAVVVDDARQRVDRVVRGDDLLGSTARQMLLYDHLGLGEPPRYWHLPIVVGADGRRLAKRHGDTRIDHYRKQGTPPERIVGLLAHWCGMGPRRPMTAERFAAEFVLENSGREQVVFSHEDDRWLLGH